MKKIFFTLTLFSLLLGSLVNSYAVEKELINFDKYESLLISSGVYPNTAPTRDQNRASAERDQLTGVPMYKITVADMLLRRWLVIINSSGTSVAAKRYSYCKRVRTKGVYGRQRNVLGARIHFHHLPYNTWAIIKPPFEIVAFDQEGKFVNIENGIIDNTGQLYQITLEVNGRNYNNSISIRLKDEMEEHYDYFMGYLYFAGWKKLIWKNPNYIENVDLREIFRLPLYPRSVPYRKFAGFVMMRQGTEVGGDFIVYIANVSVAYDRAVIVEEMDIDDEAAWRIITERQRAKAERERRLNTELIDIRRNEILRQHNSEQIMQRLRQEEQGDIQGGQGGATQPQQGQPQQPGQPGAPGQQQPAPGGQPQPPAPNANQ